MIAMFTNGGSTITVCIAANLLSVPLAGICAPGADLWPMPRMHQIAAPSTASSSGELQGIVDQSALGVWQSHPIPSPSLHGREGSSISGCVPPIDTVDSESISGH